MAGGRPTKRNDLVERQAQKLAEKGLTINEIADFLEINPATIYGWQRKDPEFFKSLKESKDIADRKVERSLFEKATGYSFASEKVFCSKDGIVTRADTIEHVPPSDTAMIFWLKNRKPEEWRDRKEIDHSGEMQLRAVIQEGSLDDDDAEST